MMRQPATTFVLQPPTFPFPLPVCWEWHEGETLPEGITFVKGTLPEDMYLKICVVQLSPPKITVEKKNIAEIDVDVKGSLKWVFKHMAGLPEWSGKIPKAPEDWAKDKCDETVRYVKSMCDRFDVEVTSDLTEEKFCFVLPTEWRFRGILKNNAPVPFEITDTNKVCFNVTHASPTLITIQLTSDITQMTTTTANIATSALTIFLIVYLLIMIIRTLREMAAPK
jgi:hypothetical protein